MTKKSKQRAERVVRLDRLGARLKRMHERQKRFAAALKTGHEDDLSLARELRNLERQTAAVLEQVEEQRAANRRLQERVEHRDAEGGSIRRRSGVPVVSPLPGRFQPAHRGDQVALAQVPVLQVFVQSAAAAVSSHQTELRL